MGTNDLLADLQLQADNIRALIEQMRANPPSLASKPATATSASSHAACQCADQWKCRKGCVNRQVKAVMEKKGYSAIACEQKYNDDGRTVVTPSKAGPITIGVEKLKLDSFMSVRRLKCHLINGYRKVYDYKAGKEHWYAPGVPDPAPRPKQGGDVPQVPIPTSNRFSELRSQSAKQEPRQAKHAVKNLAKVVETVTANKGSVRFSSEPEASVGLRLPSQYEVDTTWTSKSVPRAPMMSSGSFVWDYGRVKGGMTPRVLRLAKRNMRQTFPSWTSPVPFGPEDEIQPEFGPVWNPPRYIPFPSELDLNEVFNGEIYTRRDEDEVPGGDISEYMERRLVDVHFFPRYNFPLLDFLGLWNDSPYQADLKTRFARHFGLFFHDRNFEVKIAGKVVVEMKNWWIGKFRDSEGVNYALSEARCKVLTSEFAITAEQLYETNLYAPALGFMLSWEEQQNSSRVTSHSYYKPSLPKTIRRNRSALRTRSGLIIAGVAVASLVAGCVLIKYRRPVSRWVFRNLFRVLKASAYQLASTLVEPPNNKLAVMLAVKSVQQPVSAEELAEQVIASVVICVVSPIVEEAIKRIPYVGVLFGPLEFIAYLAIGVPVSHRLPALISHEVWRRCPYASGVVMHSAFNSSHSLGLLGAVWRGVAPIAARLVGIELNPGPSVSSAFRRVVNAFSRSLEPTWSEPIRHRSLLNCASLPQPKRGDRKPKSRLSQGTGELRPPLNLKSPLECKGKLSEYAFDTGGYKANGFASNKHNEEQSLNARVLCNTPQPTEDLPVCISWCKKNWRKIFPWMFEVESVSFEEYIARSNASPSVKRALRACKVQLVADGISEDSKLSARQLYQYTYRSSFVKVENDLYSSPLGRKTKAPRLIQGAQHQFTCLVGPWIMALQDLLKRRWSVKNFVCFTSGVSAEKAAEHVVSGEGRWLEDDLGKFDSSIRRPWCEFEVWLCKRMGAPRAVLDLMHANIATHGSTHHGWRYKCDGTRKSGDPYTSLMNSIINALSHLYLYCKWTNKSVDQARKSLRMLVQGDDNCMRHSEKRKFPWRAGMAGLGFDSEAIYRAHPYEVEFCSCRLYKVKSGVWTFGPKPGRVLAKFGYIINPPVNVSRESMMRGVALGLKRGCCFIPPINSVIERVLELTDGHVAWYERKQFHAFDGLEEEPLKPKVYHETCVDVMSNLDMNYNWDYGRQSHFDADVAKLNFGDELGKYAQLLYDRDTSGPQEIFGSWVSQQHPTPVGA